MFGEIHLCQFPFTSGAVSKTRPALVLFDLRLDAIICRITSVPHSGPLDIVLLDWQHAGLLKPSVARIDRLVTADRSIFQRRLGVLSARFGCGQICVEPRHAIAVIFPRRPI